MSFSKAPIHRFNETVSCAPSPSKYVPNINNKVKGLIPYNNQKGPRFQPSGSAERCCSQNSVKNTSEVNSRISVNRDGDFHPSRIEIHEEEKIRAKQTGSHASISYATHHPPIRRIAGSFIDMPTATNTPTPKRSASKGPPVTDKQNKRAFETQFLAKRKKLSTMKRELLEKQKNIVEAYSSLADLRDKVLDSTGKDLGPVEEIKLIDLGDLKSLLSLADSQPSKKQQAEGAGEALTPNSAPKNMAPFPSLFEKLEKKLQEIPECCMELCTSAVAKRDAISDLLKNLAVSGKMELEENQELLKRFAQEGGDLCKQLEEAKNYQNQKISEVLEEIRGAWVAQEPKPRSEPPEDVDRLELQEKLELLVVENTNLNLRLKSCTEDLEFERDRGNTLKDRKSSVDVQLKTARQKVRDMEQKLSTEEVKIAQLLSHMKSLEGQIKTKDTSFDYKAKELLKVNKAASDKVAKLEKQRESLELRVLDLKKSIDMKEEEAVTVITDLQNKLNDVIQKLQEEYTLRTKAESDLMVSKQRMLEVEEKGRELAAMAEKTKSIVVTGEESKHSAREVELWTDLQSTRVLLKSAEGQINILKEEKVKFMETMNKATVQDEGNLKEICTKYGAEMVMKDEQLKRMEEQVKDLMDSIANTQEQNAFLDRQVKEYQDRINAQVERSTVTAQLQVQVSELQQQILDLQTTLQEVVRQNEQLEQALTQKQLEVEQRDRVMREQSKVLKVRDELIGLLKGKEQRQDEQITSFHATLDEREKNADKVNKEIAAKAEEMQELYSTLESKQIQVMRLEKLVKQMEEQQERVQAQRTRHEARIAQLEHALQEKRNPRGSKFPFL